MKWHTYCAGEHGVVIAGCVGDYCIHHLIKQADLQRANDLASIVGWHIEQITKQLRKAQEIEQ